MKNNKRTDQANTTEIEKKEALRKATAEQVKGSDADVDERMKEDVPSADEAAEQVRGGDADI